jgi:hypothetical protein
MKNRDFTVNKCLFSKTKIEQINESANASNEGINKIESFFLIQKFMQNCIASTPSRKTQ